MIIYGKRPPLVRPSRSVSFVGLVAFGPKVLAEYSPNSGNFKEIARYPYSPQLLYRLTTFILTQANIKRSTSITTPEVICGWKVQSNPIELYAYFHC